MCERCNSHDHQTSDCGKSAVDLLVMAPGRIEVVQDVIAEKLDEMSALCEHWQRNRDKGRSSSAIRAALLMLAEEIVVLSRL